MVVSRVLIGMIQIRVLRLEKDLCQTVLIQAEYYIRECTNLYYLSFYNWQFN